MYFMEARNLLLLQLFLETKHHACKKYNKNFVKSPITAKVTFFTSSKICTSMILYIWVLPNSNHQ